MASVAVSGAAAWGAAGGGSGSLDIRVAASSDDAWENTAQAMNLTVGTPNVDHTDEYHGWRFLNVTIPKGATIDVASIDLDLPSSAGDEPLVEFSGEDEDDAGTFTTGSADISDRTKTTARVAWDVAQLSGPGVFTTPSLVTIIKEIVDRASWADGNALVVMCNGQSSTRDLLVTNWDSDTDLAPILHVEWST